MVTGQDQETATRNPVAIALFGVAGVLVVGVVFLATGSKDSTLHELGASTVSGCIVAFAVLFAEWSFQVRDRNHEQLQRKRDREREEAERERDREREETERERERIRKQTERDEASRQSLILRLSMGSSLAGIDLSGRDLAGMYFRSRDLRGARLIGADFSGADLSFADLSHANLTGAKLVGARIRGARFHQARLFGADLTRATTGTLREFAAGGSWDEAISDDRPDDEPSAELLELMARQQQLNLRAVGVRDELVRIARARAIFTAAEMHGVILDDAVLRNASLCGADLSGARMTRTQLKCADLEKVKLRQNLGAGPTETLVSTLSELEWTLLKACGWTFSTSDPDHQDFRGGAPPPISGIGLPEVTLTGTVLTRANLSGLDLAPEIKVSGADIAGAIGIPDRWFENVERAAQ